MIFQYFLHTNAEGCKFHCAAKKVKCQPRIIIGTRKGFFEKKKKKKKTNNKKQMSPRQSFLFATFHLVLFYICTKYHQNIPKGICVTEQRQVIKFKHKKGRYKA